jgi:hypothetical protein
MVICRSSARQPRRAISGGEAALQELIARFTEGLHRDASLHGIRAAWQRRDGPYAWDSSDSVYLVYQVELWDAI